MAALVLPRAAIIARATPTVLFSLPPANASSARPTSAWSVGSRLILFRIIETHRLQFGENCADENLRLNAKYYRLGIVGHSDCGATKFPMRL